MPVYYVGILKNKSKPAVELVAEKDLSSLSRFTRSNWEEFIDFGVRYCAERLKQGERGQIDVAENKSGEYTFQAYDYKGGICGVVVTDNNYNERVGQAILALALKDFVTKYPESSYAHLQPSPKGSKPPLDLPQLKEYIVKYQRPEDVDPILKIQIELDETKTFMHKSMEAMLERGEKIDSLVAKSDNLSSQSKMFYTQAKKQNSCCNVM